MFHRFHAIAAKSKGLGLRMRICCSCVCFGSVNSICVARVNQALVVATGFPRLAAALRISRAL